MYKKLEEIVVATGRFILLFVGINVLLTSILLLCNISVSAANIIVSYSLTCILFFVLCKQVNRRKCISWVVIAAIVILLTIFLNTLIHEIAYDGNLYHKFAVGVLEMGWNPIYENVADYFHKLGIPGERWSNTDIWVACYPKASWYFAASIYRVTGNIESAKAFNLLIAYSTFAVCLDYFNHKLKGVWVFLMALMFTAIPATVAQIFTYYVDGSLGGLLFSSIIILISLSDQEYQGNKKKQLLYLAICIILCGNLKFTGIAYEAAFCAVFFFYWTICLIRKQKKQAVFVMVRLAAYYTIVVVVMVGVVGGGTYLTNIRDYGSIAYPITDQELVNSSNSLQSVGLEDKSPVFQILAMLFVRTSTQDSKALLEWKLPFTFHKSELKDSCHDTIRGGGGVFFSGILCVTMYLFFYLIRRLYRFRRKDLYHMGLAVMTGIVLIVLVPAGGQIRYSPYVYLFPYFVIYWWVLCYGNYQGGKRILGYILVGLTLVNGFIFAEYALRGLIQTVDYGNRYREMKESDYVEIDTILPGTVFNFRDQGIKYRYNTEQELTEGKLKYLQLTYNMKKE